MGINDSIDPVTGCCYYERWKKLLMRIFCPKYLARQPTYFGCTIEESWKTFSVFREWMSKQDWQGKELDKDLLVFGNKHYGPTTCIFVPKAINLLLCMRGNDRGPYPVGVTRITMNAGRYSYFQARCSFYGKTKRLGLFATVEEASACYQQAKLTYIRELANNETNPALKQALLRLH